MAYDEVLAERAREALAAEPVRRTSMLIVAVKPSVIASVGDP